ncbi:MULTISPECIES: lytic transglycosylase domain-containing protein [Enterobacterales]|uniref:Lytic transglycosylase domain-containing protein n=12 Tax=Enterobacterales TaxID=91347 RepID=A0ABD5C3A5_ECOLX|nr:MULTISPECIES: lytic transglycosylase domain-containing protein [Enterobacterales]EAQ9256983.1 traL protein [Salmonella enterica]EBU7828328.1 traL protein [Salmonella enterica subsp. enterica serovar Panama]EBY5477415.1 traL protein [Salmonella enterica subsp. enterica serovar Enteritidis]ECQ1243065.1 lytic transglycosylase domain-containing protein [Salmonella enterica subsp. enterica serovar Kedougou]ECR6329471.1 lytic transglycosylase domain-containing protein [Salmonella enterica subsp. 
MKKSWCLIAVCISGLSFQGGAHAASASDTIASLAARCAPDVSPLTMAYIVGHESGNNPYFINVNRGANLKRQPQTEAEAVEVANRLIKNLKKDESIDMGLAMINSNNLSSLGITVEQVFKPCINLRASQTILKDCYSTALKSNPPGQIALRHALSCYNTGSQVRGISNGYVTKVINVAKQSDLKIPTLLPDGQNEEAESQPVSAKGATFEGEHDAFTGESDSGGDVFSQDNTDAFLTKAEQKGSEVMNDKNLSPVAVSNN